MAAAEIVTLRGDDLGALNLYDEAIESTEENGFLQYDALARELAARFWLGRGKRRFGTAY